MPLVYYFKIILKKATPTRQTVLYNHMKTLIKIIPIFMMTACNWRSENKSTNKIDTDSVKNDTIIINHRSFIQTLENEKFGCLVSIKGDTVIKYADYYHQIEVLDIDEDGYKDIRVFVISNTPNKCDNYFFDKNISTFKKIENCDLDIQKIKGTGFYYSYNRAGCADMNWESYLSKIEAYELVSYGYILGKGCDFEVKNNPQTIKIYKIINSNTDEKVLIKQMPYLKYITRFSDKHSFIKKYWKQNFNAFDR